MSLLSATAATVALAGLVVAATAIFRDRARGRRRCPRCWYDMSAAGGSLTCPECGRTHRSARSLLRARRRWRIALAALAISGAAAAAALRPVAALDAAARVVPIAAWRALLTPFGRQAQTERDALLSSSDFSGWASLGRFERLVVARALVADLEAGTLGPSDWRVFADLDREGLLALPDIERTATLDPDALQRRYAVCALGDAELARERVLPVLVAAARTDRSVSVRCSAVHAIANRSASEATIDVLVGVLSDSSSDVRSAAALGLGRRPTAAHRRAIPALIESTRDAQPFHSQAVATALARLSPGDPGPLVRLLEAGKVQRPAAAHALQGYGPDAAPAAPALARALDDPSADTRRSVMLALVAIHPENGPAALEAVARAAVEDESVEVRHAAVFWLSAGGTADCCTLSALSGALGDEDANIRGLAAAFLRDAGPAAAPARAALETAVHDPDPRVAQLARQALVAIYAAPQGGSPP